MNDWRKVLAPLAVVLVVVAGVIAYNNNASLPRDEVEPLPASGKVQDAANLLTQEAAAEEAIMAETDSDLDELEADSNDAQETTGAYDENAL